MQASRTKRTIQNSKVSLLFFVLQIIVGFYSRKIFLEYLGDEVIGLNTTLGNILSFLNLAELGIGVAMATSLYKPIHDNNFNKIKEIVTVQGILYRKIALLLCGMSVPILIALPFIFPSTKCGLLYVSFSYIVFLSGSIFSYLWNYREILIEADQKSFKLTPWMHFVRYGKIFIQILILLYSNFGIWGWITAELAGNILTVFIINHVIKKEYPWLKKCTEPEAVLLKKYKNLLTKTKQLFVHKIAGFILYQTSPFVIYAFISLEMVTYYGNYMMLIGYCLSFINVTFGGMSASIGNLVADNNKQHTIDVFWELFTSRIWIGGIVCFVTYISIRPFISIWIGAKYVLDDSTLLLLILYMFIQISRSVIESFKDALQLFGDVWAPIVEASINLGGSILLGYLWGLNGILIGINLSLIIIVLIWRPYYIFHNGISYPVTRYYLYYLLHTITFIFCAYVVKYIMGMLGMENNIVSLILKFLFGTCVYIISTYVILMLFTTGMRRFTYRIINIVTKKYEY